MRLSRIYKTIGIALAFTFWPMETVAPWPVLHGLYAAAAGCYFGGFLLHSYGR